MLPRQPVIGAASFLTVLLLVTSAVEAQRSQCPELCTCYFGFVSCYDFTESSLQNLPSDTNTIILHGGRVSSFPPGFLKDIPRIDLLEIQSCQVGEILPETFAGLTAVEQISITECQFGHIQRNAFSDMSKITKFYMSSSNISMIHSGAFSRLKEFGDLSLWSNNIETIEPGAFSELSDFLTFSFYMNNVTTLAPDAFDKAEELEKVEFYLNQFQYLGTGPAIPFQDVAAQLSVHTNTFPCDCEIVKSLADDFLFNKFLSSNQCIKNGTIIRLSELSGEGLCDQRVNITVIPFSRHSTTTTTATTTEEENGKTTTTTTTQQRLSTKGTTSAPFTKTTKGSPGGSDITTRGSPSSTTKKEGEENKGDSEKATGRNSGNSLASKGTIVSLTVVPVLVAVGLFVVFLRVRHKKRQRRLLKEDRRSSHPSEDFMY